MFFSLSLVIPKQLTVNSDGMSCKRMKNKFQEYQTQKKTEPKRIRRVLHSFLDDINRVDFEKMKNDFQEN